MQGPIDKGSGPVTVEPSKTGRVIGLAVVGALGGFLFGYDSAVINGATVAIYHEFGIESGLLQGFVVSIALLGSAVGAFFGGRFANNIGRKKVMLIAALLFLIAGLGTGLPFSMFDFMFWRLVGGFAIGLAAVVSPAYIAEISPAHLRGRLASLFQMAIVIGIFMTQLMNQLILAGTGGPEKSIAEGGSASNTWLFGLQAWQLMFLSMVIPAIIYFLLASTLPESPRWLVMKGRKDEAYKVLSTILVNDPAPKVREIEESVQMDHEPSMRDIRGHSFGLMPIVWVGIILAVFQQFVGINAVFYYSNLIWASVGFSDKDAFLTSTIISAVNVIFTFVAIALIDRLGRKILLIIGSMGMTVTLGILTVVFTAAPKNAENAPVLSGSGSTLAVLSLNVYVAFFAATWGPIVWVLLGEMFSNTIRASAMAVGVAANWIANFIVSETFPKLVQVSIGLAYGIFTFCAFISIFYVLKFVRETKGVSLEDMEQLEGIERPSSVRK